MTESRLPDFIRVSAVLAWATINKRVSARPPVSLDSLVVSQLVVVWEVGDFVQNYNDMREANTIGADAYFHCRANCEASARGPAGEAVAGVISDTREMVDQATGDPASASAADQRANEQGRSAPTQPGFQGCEAACSSLRPPALSREYGHPPPPPPPDDQRTRPGGRYH